MTPQEVLSEFFRLEILPAGGINLMVIAVDDMIMVYGDSIEFLDGAAAALRRSGRFAYVRDRSPDKSILLFEWQADDQGTNDE